MWFQITWKEKLLFAVLVVVVGYSTGKFMEFLISHISIGWK